MNRFKVKIYFVILNVLFVTFYCEAQKDLINLKSNKLHTNNKKNDNFCKLLDSINVNDQLYRGNDTFTEIAYVILDSVYNANNIAFFPDNSGRKASKNLTMKEKMKYSDITSEIIDKKFPKFTTKKWKKRQDSLMKLQIILDNKNTKQLIDIIENHGGYPNKDNCSCEEETLKSLIVFRHSQTQYFDKIRVLIEQEHDVKRLPDGKYKIFLDHINGRTGKGL